MTDSVHYDASFTRNMGNFESLKLSIGFTSDVRKGENEEDALTRVKEFIGSKLLTEVDEVESDIRGIVSAATERAKKSK